jgi:hypothetical protein
MYGGAVGAQFFHVCFIFPAYQPCCHAIVCAPWPLLVRWCLPPSAPPLALSPVFDKVKAYQRVGMGCLLRCAYRRSSVIARDISFAASIPCCPPLRIAVHAPPAPPVALFRAIRAARRSYKPVVYYYVQAFCQRSYVRLVCACADGSEAGTRRRSETT